MKEIDEMTKTDEVKADDDAIMEMSIDDVIEKDSPSTLEKNDILVEINNLTKSYGSFVALKDLHIKMPRGKVIGLLGPNGSGKTTLIKLMANLLMNYEGDIFIDGNRPGIETKKIISYLPDRNYLSPNWILEDAIEYFKDFYDDFDEAKARKLIAQLNIPQKKKFKQLSKGTKEKLQLLLVLSRKAKLYILDEPIAGVDPAVREWIFNLIMNHKSADASVIMSTHLISEIEEILDYAVFLKDGRVNISGTVEDIKTEFDKGLNDLFKEVYRYA